MPELSVVVPVYNDQEVLSELFNRLIPVLIKETTQFEIIFIDDGSSDDSFEILKKYHNQDNRIKILKFIRNYGQSNAITAGLEKAKGKNIVIMDSDLQDRPEDIPLLLTTLRNSNVKIVIAQQKKKYTNLIKTFISHLFFQFSNLVTNIQHPPNLGVFRAFYKEVYDTHIKPLDYCGTTLSQFYRLHLQYEIIPVVRDKRFSGKSGYDLKKMFQLVFDRILPHLRCFIVPSKRKPYYEIDAFIG